MDDKYFKVNVWISDTNERVCTFLADMDNLIPIVKHIFDTSNYLVTISPGLK